MRSVHSVAIAACTLCLACPAEPEHAPDAGDSEDVGAADASLDSSRDVSSGEEDAGDRDASDPGCGEGDACLYTWTPQPFSVNTSSITFTDVIGRDRTLNLAIYSPDGEPANRPVVLLSHGGASGKTDPLKSMDKWAPLFASAGYYAVAIAHTGRSDIDERQALCQAIGIPGAEACEVFKPLNYDRPNDVAAVLDELVRRRDRPPLAGVYDLDRVAHVGHSAGAGAALMLAGVTRNYRGDGHDGYRDERVDVVVALSPQGPNSDLFEQDESFDTAAIPILLGTGAGDVTADLPEERRSTFDFLPPGDKALLYIDDPTPIHTTYELEQEPCVNSGGTPEACARFVSWIGSFGVAFVDAKLLGDADAVAWLEGDSPTSIDPSITFLKK